MTIEIAPPVAPVKTAPANETTGVKEKSNASEKSKPEDAAGFLAILASLGGASSTELPAVNAGLPLDGVPIASDPTLTGTQPQDAASLLAQALQWTIPSGAPSADTRGVDGDSSQLAGVIAPTPASLAGVKGTKLDALAQEAGTLNADAGWGATQQAAISGALRKGSKDQLDTAALQSLPATGMAALGVTENRTDGQDTKFIQVDLVAKMAPSIVESIAPTSINLTKREERSSVAGVFQPNATQEVVAAPSPTGWAGNIVGSSALAAPDAAMVTQTYVAEKIAYWISNDVQKAEMKLDGLGDQPVEVSISMNGNQAHVAFRTDEVQARDALENAGLQLKEMLQKDGVVLSGMSVGTSASGNSGAGGQQDRNARQGSKSVLAMVDQPARGDRAVNGQNTVGRALDLFV